MKRKVSIFLAVLLFSLSFITTTALAAKLNKSKITLKVGQTYKLKVLKNRKKITWKSSNKKVATVSKKGVIKARKKGKATITAKVGSKKYKCKVTVIKKKNKTKKTTAALTTTTVPKTEAPTTKPTEIQPTQPIPTQTLPINTDNTKPSVINPKTNIKIGEEYVGNKYALYDDGIIYAGGIAFYDDDPSGIYCLLLEAMFEKEGPKERTPVEFGGEKYYRNGSGFTPYHIEFTDTEIIVKNSFYDETEVVTLKMQLWSDGDLRVTQSNHANFSAGDILSIKWNYLEYNE